MNEIKFEEVQYFMPPSDEFELYLFLNGYGLACFRDREYFLELYGT